MENFLSGMEYFFSLGFLVDLGNFYAAKCADIGGDWVSTATGSWECVNTNLDAKLAGYIDSLR
jgi:hypothetical protein